MTELPSLESLRPILAIAELVGATFALVFLYSTVEHFVLRWINRSRT